MSTSTTIINNNERISVKKIVINKKDAPKKVLFVKLFLTF